MVQFAWSRLEHAEKCELNQCLHCLKHKFELKKKTQFLSLLCCQLHKESLVVS